MLLTYHIRYCVGLEEFLAINFFCKNGPFFFFWGVFHCAEAVASTEMGVSLIFSGVVVFSIRALIFYFFSTKYLRVSSFILFIFWYFFLFNLFLHKDNMLSSLFLKYFLDTEELFGINLFNKGNFIVYTWEVSFGVVLFFFFIHIFLFFFFLYEPPLSFSFFVSFFNYFLFIVLILLNDDLYCFLCGHSLDFVILIVLFFFLTTYCISDIATIFREGDLFREL